MQTTYLIRNVHPEYITSPKTTTKENTPQNRRTLINTTKEREIQKATKMIKRWLVSLPLEKCK